MPCMDDYAGSAQWRHEELANKTKYLESLLTWLSEQSGNEKLLEVHDLPEFGHEFLSCMGDVIAEERINIKNAEYKLCSAITVLGEDKLFSIATTIGLSDENVVTILKWWSNHKIADRIRKTEELISSRQLAIEEVVDYAKDQLSSALYGKDISSISEGEKVELKAKIKHAINKSVSNL